MSVVITSIKLVVPLLLLIAVGVLLKKYGVLSDVTVTEMNRLVLLLFIPANIFNSLYNADFTTDFSFGFIAFMFAAAIFSVIMAFITFGGIKDPRQKSAVIHASVRPNTGIFGLALAEAVYGNLAMGVTAVGAAFTAPFYNLYGIVVFEHFTGGNVSFGKQLKKILTNPVVFITIVALIVKLSGIVLPDMITTGITYISRGTTGISLIMLGASFKLQKGADRKLTAFAIAFKMVMLPALVILAAVLLGFRNNMLVAIICMIASPVAVSAYSMAAGYDTDHKLTSEIVVFSYVISIVTLSAIISIVRLLGLI